MSFDQLAAACPVDLGVSNPVRISQEMVDVHAATTGDAQWIHNDPERARRESPFGGPIAQGFLLTALLTRLSGGFSYPELGPMTMLVNYGFDRVRFLSPVLVDSTVTLHGTLAEVRSKSDGSAVLAVDLQMRSGDETAPSMVARWLFLAVPDSAVRR